MFQYIKEQWANGRAIYGKKSWRETRRVILHFLRTLRNKREMTEFKAYFSSYGPDPHILEKQEGLYELMSRVFFYRDSTVAERLEAVKNHFDELERRVNPETIRFLYSDKDNCGSEDRQGLLLWEDKSLDMTAYLNFMTGQRKEGLLTIVLQLGKQGLYHVNFRLGKGFDGEPALWIGTIQGYKDGLDNAKQATKKMHGYRPKNFIVFLVRELAACCGIKQLYAVSDEGFYANTHMIRGHKAKVIKLDPLWEDIGGILSEDPRFYSIPAEEYRKPLEEIKSQKRSQYRKRYEMLDQYAADIRSRLIPHITGLR